MKSRRNCKAYRYPIFEALFGNGTRYLGLGNAAARFARLDVSPQYRLFLGQSTTVRHGKPNALQTTLICAVFVVFDQAYISRDY